MARTAEVQRRWLAMGRVVRLVPWPGVCGLLCLLVLGPRYAFCLFLGEEVRGEGPPCDPLVLGGVGPSAPCLSMLPTVCTIFTRFC